MTDGLDVVDEQVRAMEDNVEQTAAWDGPLFDVWLHYRGLIESAMRPISESALALHPPPPGARCLDIGCGLGDTTFRLAELVGLGGSARGVDVAPRMIAAAKADLEREGTDNVSFAVADVETDDLGGTYDYAFGRCGVMFFAHPVPAFRNVCRHLAPGSVINLIVWRRKIDNEWIHTAELAVEKYLDHPEESDVPTCGPGPFAMANADVITEQLKYGGFEDIRLARRDLLYKMGDDLDQAVEFNMALGPAAEILRQWGDRIDEVRPTIAADIREVLSRFVTDDGSVRGLCSVWVASGRKPAPSR
ncbi:MAG TPA: class I SAM-dependent methyltransferase [Solirubrobacteraceae bacterium]|nr:class I SAM-dependent methyltransferase [Solirubrobacteraceae bacterium]